MFDWSDDDEVPSAPPPSTEKPRPEHLAKGISAQQTMEVPTGQAMEVPEQQVEVNPEQQVGKVPEQ